MPYSIRFLLSLLLLCTSAFPALAQQAERKVNDPIAAAEAERKSLRQQPPTQVNIVVNVAPGKDEHVDIVSDKQEVQGDVTIATGNVQVSGNGILLIADRVTYNEVTSDLTAEGNVFFEQEGQRLVGERMELNAKTKRGTLYSISGFTSRTPDGAELIIDADRADKTGEDTYNLDNARLTACQDRVPKWSFTAKRARLRLDHRAKVYNAFFRVKDVPIFYLPYASIPINKKDRSSGFLLPSSGASNIRGRTLRIPYYQTLGRSADILFRTEVFTKRGLGFNVDFRARTNETSFINVGTFLVFDRLLGPKRDPAGNLLPDQGGSSFYVDAVHNFKNGFTAVADVNITSNFAFRQVFGDNILTAISPEERSIFYLNKNWRSFSFNGLFGEQSFFIGRIVQRDGQPAFDDQIVKMRQFPSVEFTQRSSRVSEKFPAYFSFAGALEGVRRSETSGEQFNLKTPSAVQRLDFFPRLTFPLKPIAGFTFTPSLGIRSTFYSDSLDPVQRQAVGRNLFRNYAEFHLDVRPPALAKVFHHRNGQPWFKHIIEPYIEYRRIAGIDDFQRTLRIDERDPIANTNEIEYGITNRFFVRRKEADGKTTQPHEYLNLTIAQKYFFDPTFGGAFRPCTSEQYAANTCARNQFFPLNTLSGWSFGGTMRALSPLNVRARVRLNPSTFADVRLNYDTRFHGLRDVIFGGGYQRGIFFFSNNWYYTRRVAVDPARYELPADPSTLPGNQVDLAAFIGNPVRGPYGGVVAIYDLRNQMFNGMPRDRQLINLTSTAGWAWDCCSVQAQAFTFNAGFRNESRVIFTFTLKGIGTFGTENIGQRRY